MSALKQLPDLEIDAWPTPDAGIADINLHITQGELVLVSGPVASGKSTLMKRFVVHILRDFPGNFVPLIVTVIRLGQMMKTGILELDSTSLLQDYVCVLFGEATPA